MPPITDDKSELCIPFILEQIQAHRQSTTNSGPPLPFFLGINGVQGAGKTTLVDTLCSLLTSAPHNLPTVVLSIDDLYLPHDEQVALARSHPHNPLVQHRGQPSTHDVKLGLATFEALRSGATAIGIPSYDKSAFSGQGDRVDPSTWRTVNESQDGRIGVVIFEGWCVGFRPLSGEQLARALDRAKNDAEQPGYSGQLARLKLEDIRLVNDALERYDSMTDYLDALIHIDAEDTLFVYSWRQEQEAALRAARGSGMTEEQVMHFVNGYYPAYELYGGQLRQGIFRGKGRQLRLVVGPDRRVKQSMRI